MAKCPDSLHWQNQ